MYSRARYVPVRWSSTCTPCRYLLDFIGCSSTWVRVVYVHDGRVQEEVPLRRVHHHHVVVVQYSTMVQ